MPRQKVSPALVQGLPTQGAQSAVTDSALARRVAVLSHGFRDFLPSFPVEFGIVTDYRSSYYNFTLRYREVFCLYNAMLMVDKCNHHSSRLCTLRKLVVTDVLGQRIGHIFKGQADQEESLKMEPIDCPEMSVTNDRTTRRNRPEGRISYFHCDITRK